MPTTAKLRHLRIAPRKVRLVADLIRGKSIEQAQNILNFTRKRAAVPILKLLNSALANAKSQFQLEESNLYINKITVDEGPKLKRWMPRARGQVAEIQKKTSHITLFLDSTKPGKSRKKPKKSEKKSEEERKEMKMEKPKTRTETERPKPKIERGIKRVFRRKSF